MIITEETLKKVLEALANHQFTDRGCYNNDDVTYAMFELEYEMDNQPKEVEKL